MFSRIFSIYVYTTKCLIYVGSIFVYLHFVWYDLEDVLVYYLSNKEAVGTVLHQTLESFSCYIYKAMSN